MTRIKATSSFEIQAGARVSLGMFVAVLIAAALTTKVSNAGSPDGYGDKLGSVNFPTSCNAAAQPLMERGLALLHHMTFKGAERAFDAAQKADPDCALAYWGIAMSFIHPVWPDRPSIVQFARAADLLAMANSRGRKTPRESAYIEALNSYYANAQERDERSRLASHAEAWAEVYKAFPDDLEAAAIAALAHLATASFLDKSNRKPKAAGAMAEEVLARNPEHPGGHHYVIHSYDIPDLANRALGVARRYGRLAPEVPHALHMPTHIFTRLGLWEESIAWNLRSSAAAFKRGAAGASPYAHALDYLAYAYLQQAEDKKAAEIVKTVHNLPTQFYWSKSGSFGYALAALAARYALERRQWAEAAALDPDGPAEFKWGGRYPEFQAITYFARALGAARGGDPRAAAAAIKELSTLHALAATRNAYWANQVEIQQMAAEAWIALADGRPDQALARMRGSAKLEAATEKHPVTPGEVLPARELLGDMLLELNRPAEALKAYKATLARAPGRFNSLYGAGRAAELADDRQTATAYYRKLLEVAAKADTVRPRLLHARKFLN